MENKDLARIVESNFAAGEWLKYPSYKPEVAGTYLCESEIGTTGTLYWGSPCDDRKFKTRKVIRFARINL